MRLIRIILLLFLAEAALPAVALADKRIALMIGNATYADAAASTIRRTTWRRQRSNLFEAAGFDAVEGSYAGSRARGHDPAACAPFEVRRRTPTSP